MILEIFGFIRPNFDFLTADRFDGCVWVDLAPGVEIEFFVGG